MNPNRIFPDNLECQSKLWYWKITNALWLLASPLPWLLALSLVSSNEGKPRVAGYKRHRVQELLIAVERYSPTDWIFKNLASDLCSRYGAFTQLSVLYNMVGMLRVKGEGFGSEVMWVQYNLAWKLLKNYLASPRPPPDTRAHLVDRLYVYYDHT